MDTKEADPLEKISELLSQVGVAAESAEQVIRTAYFYNGEPIADTMKNRAELHKRAVERRKKAKRGGKR